MIKCEVIKDFTLEKFDELKNIVRYNPNKKEIGRLYEKDIFECTEEMGKYLTGNNNVKKIVVKILEVIPEDVKVEENITIKEEKKSRKKKTSKK